MKKLTLVLTALMMVAAITFTSCKKTKTVVKTLKERVQGNCYGLGSVTKNGTPVTSDFTGFKICFSGDAGSGSITTGGTSSQNVSVTYNVGDGTITLTSATVPTGWAATLTSASATDDGASFTFSVVITHPKTGAATHVFSLAKQ